MTSRERILTTLNHEQPDRCATYFWADKRAQQVLRQHFGVDTEDALERALGVDRWRSVKPARSLPADYEARVSRFVPSQYAGQADYRIGKDGRVYRNHPAATYLDDVVWNPLQAVERVSELSAYPLPLPQEVQCNPQLSAHVQALKNDDAVVCGVLDQPFKLIWQLFGMENALCNLIALPEVSTYLYHTFYEYITLQAVLLAQAGVDVVQIIGDIAMQNSLMMSPKTWRQYDKPRLAGLIHRVKEANPRVKIYMHSDGDMSAIVPDLVDVGLDILNPIQPECMDPFEIKRRWGKHLVLHGGVSLQRTIPFGTAEAVRQEVRQLIDICGRGGGFVLGPSNQLMAEFPIENIVALYQAVCVDLPSSTHHQAQGIPCACRTKV